MRCGGWDAGGLGIVIGILQTAENWNMGISLMVRHEVFMSLRPKALFIMNFYQLATQRLLQLSPNTYIRFS